MTIRTTRLTRFAAVLVLTGAVIILSGLRVGTPAAAVQTADGNSCGARGIYGYTGFGNTFAGNLLGFPVGTASTNGTLTFDKDGNWSVREIEMVNGQVLNSSATFEGTLTVNPDCTFTGTISGLGTALVGVVVDHGKQVRAMTTIPGVQINFVSTVKIAP